MTDPDTRNVADSVHDMLIDGIKPQLLSLDRGTAESASALLVPNGMKVESIKPLLDAYLDAPERRKGHSDHTDLATFIAWINRYRSDNTVVFARDDRSAPKLVAIFNHHPEGDDNVDAGWGDFRATYHFPLSEEWKAWKKFDSQIMSQAEFAEFIEDRINDVVPAPTSLDGKTGDVTTILPPAVSKFLALSGGRCALPAEIMTLSRGLKVHVDEQVERQIDLQSGAATLLYNSDHKDAAGQKVNVPQIFLIGVPVFHNADPYLIAARLRYRIANGSIKWGYVLHRADEVFDDAFKGAVGKVTKETEVPAFIGTQN